MIYSFNAIYWTVVFLVLPVAVFAYLDPGSGAVLVNLIIAGIAALVFSLKGVFLRLIGKGDKLQKKMTDAIIPQIGLLSEGRQYYATFEPIVSALIRNQIHFVYYTLDIEDRILDIESEFMSARFLGYGSIGFHRAVKLSVKNLICTTPNIGTIGYPIAKPHKVENLIHIFHSINDLSMYKKGSLDHYDTVFMVGDFQTHSIRDLESKRGKKKKKLIPLGIPYLDVYQKDVWTTIESGLAKTVLVASSWGSKGLFQNYGTDFIKVLASEGFRIIARPHPQSYLSEPRHIEVIEREVKTIPNALWDAELSPSESMNQADILISDTSSIRFDFAFLYQKPVITLEVCVDEMPGFERDDMKELWMDDAATQIGIRIGKEDISDISIHVNNALNSFDQEKIRNYRDTILSNFGNAGEAMARYIANNLIDNQ